ncbi:agmatinase [Pseudomonas aeruginosa]|uniref:agmatinase n=1 Tax=Pseudomonas aeruginosa TaxID=287 RepID=UPI000F523C3A|nr:agmatinase [Pseudomonas aeruginosa]RPV49005.1 agmatinase [Pseudomonas aeruginosa]
MTNLKELRRLAEECDASLADKQFNKASEMSHDPSSTFSGIRTFLRQSYQAELKDLDVALIGIPSDLGVTNRSGARFGPSAVRDISAIAGGPMHHASGIVPTNVCRIADCGDVPISHLYNLEETIEEIEVYYNKVKDAGIVPISVGGDHSVTYPILKALGRDESLGLVHIDAHCDTCGDVAGSKFHHGGPFRNAALDGLIDPERTIQIGIRGRAEPYWEFSYRSGMHVVHIEEVHQEGIESIIERVHRVIGDRPFYLSIDVDGIDPAYAPGTGTPEVGGMRPEQVQALIRSLQGKEIVGADVVEVAPQYDTAGQTTALVAATIMWEALCVISDRIARQQECGLRKA